MSDNPFVYGEIVPAESFVGRELELHRLATDLADGQKVFLISPRRYGKSSLVRQAFETLARRRVVTLEFTVSSFSSYVAFLEGYAQALIGLEKRAGRARSWLRGLFSTATPEVRFEAGTSGGGLTVAFPSVRTARDAARLAEEVFALPARLADRLGRRLAIALDEFQAISSFDVKSVEGGLRPPGGPTRQGG
jgi:AAA+ ATPase superfamily predicted ATPase